METVSFFFRVKNVAIYTEIKAFTTLLGIEIPSDVIR